MSKELLQGLENKNTSNQLPVNLFELIKLIKNEIDLIKEYDNFVIESSGLIVNNYGIGCKGYCMGDNKIPNICGKGENCNNFNRANLILKNISEFKNEQLLKEIY